jgi:hypothetical protein
VQRAEKRGAEGERLFTVTLPAGVTRQYRLRLSGRAPLGGRATFTLPDVTVAGSAVKGRWLAVTGEEVRAEEARGLDKVGDLAQELRAWPAEAERVRRGGQAWRVRQDGWQLKLTPVGAPAAPPVQVVLAEQEAAVLDGRRWAHQATYTLFARGGAELHLTLPRGAKLLLATVDGRPETPRQPEPERLWLSLQAGDGVRVLRLRWAYEGNAESLGGPRLQTPVFKDLTAPPVLWTVQAPPGWRLRPGTEPGQAPPAGAAAVALTRAEAQLRLSALLAEFWQTDEAASRALLAAQRRFAWHCRVAAYRLAQEGAAAVGRGPKGQGLADWLEELRGQNGQLARQLGFDHFRVQGEKEAVAGAGTGEQAPPGGAAPLALADRGTPHSWQGTAAAAPRPRLAAAAAEQTRLTLGASLLLVAALAAVWLLAYFRRVAAALRHLLPEQLVLVAAAGWLVFGVSLVAVLLLVVGVGARLVLATGAVRRWWRREPAAALPAGSSVGSVA